MQVPLSLPRLRCSDPRPPFAGCPNSMRGDDQKLSELLAPTTNHLAAWSYLIPMTIESGPTSGSTREDEKPACFIQPQQSAPV